MDLGLGYVGDGFDIVEEEDYLQEQQLLVGAEGMSDHLMENADDLVSAAGVPGR